MGEKTVERNSDTSADKGRDADDQARERERCRRPSERKGEIEMTERESERPRCKRKGEIQRTEPQ